MRATIMPAATDSAKPINSRRESRIPNLASAAWIEPSGGPAGVAGGVGVAEVVAARPAPHCGQKDLPIGTVAPHRTHRVPSGVCGAGAARTGARISGEPHWRQNFLPGGFASPHLLQFIYLASPLVIS